MSELEASCIGASCDTIQAQVAESKQVLQRLSDSRALALIAIREQQAAETSTEETEAVDDKNQLQCVNDSQAELLKQQFIALCPGAAYVITAEGVELSCPYIGPSDAQD